MKLSYIMDIGIKDHTGSIRCVVPFGSATPKNSVYNIVDIYVKIVLTKQKNIITVILFSFIPFNTNIS